MHLINNDFEIHLITLETPEDQGRGFMYHRRIPTHYGLYFPGCGEHAFHMCTVEAPLLLLGIDRDNKVHSIEVREPNSPGKKLKSRVPLKHVIELHPKFQKHFHIGDTLRFRD